MATLLAPQPAPAREPRPMLRVLACGSVDDGKSTLLGRLVHDAAGLYADQAAAIDGDYANLFDGLEAEREQGITIDVAYRYFATPARKFIVIDAPGHEQYTRNMVTGASNADLAIVLVDATRGVTRQTRRHSRILRLLGVGHVVLAVNKLDLVGLAQERFDAIVADYAALARQIGLERFEAAPLIARDGDNVARPSARMPWYRGPTLLDLLEEAEVHHDADPAFVLPVQTVLRAGARTRWLAGTVASGAVAPGARLRVLPGGQAAHVAEVFGRARADAGQAVSLRLGEEVDCARGDVLASADARVAVADRLTADLVWFGDRPLAPGARYLLKLGHRTVGARVASVRDVFEAETGLHGPARAIAANDIAGVAVSLDAAVAVATFADHRMLGGFILIDPADQATVAAGLVRGVAAAGEASAAYRIVGAAEDRRRLAQDLADQLRAAGRVPEVIDDLLLADLAMPAGDDAALGALVRLLRRAGVTPVLALAAETRLGTSFAAGHRLAGADDWVI